MDETEFVGVQADASGRVGLCAVFFVAGYWCFHPFHVGPYLILLARVEREFHEGVVPPFPQDGIVRGGLLSRTVARGPDFAVAVFAEESGDGSFRLRQAPLHDGRVASIEHHGFPVLLQDFLCPLVFGINHQTGSFPVEAVHHKEPGRGIVPFDIFAQDVEGGFAVLFFGTDRKQSVPFVGNYQPFVFVHDAEHRVMQCSGCPVFCDRNRVACCQRGVVAGGMASVHRDLSVRQIRFHGAAASAFHAFQQKRQQRAVSLYFIFHRS